MRSGLGSAPPPPGVSPPAPARRYRVGGLVVETTVDAPFCEAVLTRDRPDVTLEHGVPWDRAPATARALGRAEPRLRHRITPETWISVDMRGNWVECGRDGAVRAGLHPDFDWRRRDAPGEAEYWSASLTISLTGIFFGAYDRPRHVGVHAAAAAPAPGGPAVLLTGPSGAGKSTIATALQMLGWHWIAREATRVEAPAGPGGPWRVEAEWPIKHVGTPGRAKWPTFIPAGPRFLAAGAPLGAVYALATRRHPDRVRIERASPGMAGRMRREARLYTLLHLDQPDCRLWLSDHGPRWDAGGPPVYLVERPRSFKATDTAPFVARHALEVFSRARGCRAAVPVPAAGSLDPAQRWAP